MVNIYMNENVIFYANTDGHIAPSPDFMRMFEYLQLSRSYRIALTVISGQLHRDLALQEVPDIDVVIKVATDFGDVKCLNFKDWWDDKGLLLFGDRGIKPEARIILELPAVFAGVPHMLQKAAFNFYPKHMSHTVHGNVYVEIPKSLTRAELIKFVGNLHKKIQHESRSFKPTPKYALTKSKVNDQTLDLGLEFLRLYMDTDLSMWRIASKIGLSKTLSDQVDPDAKRQPQTSLPITRSLDVMASKLKNKAIALAENAARGIFPSTAPLPFPPPSYR